MASSKAQTDKEKAAEAEKNTESGRTTTGRTNDSDSTDPADQPNFGMPEGVSTSATRGEYGDTTEPQELPNPTVEEQESSAVYIEHHPEAAPGGAEAEDKPEA